MCPFVLSNAISEYVLISKLVQSGSSIETSKIDFTLDEEKLIKKATGMAISKQREVVMTLIITDLNSVIK